ncbi:MAG: hypothetical protein WB992_23925 [Bryobacteraceae bacterium]
MLDLITTQINFGLAYAREAHSAYEGGRGDYGDTAKQIAVRAYSTAVRFAGRLSHEPGVFLLNRLAELENELGVLFESPEMCAKSIA